MIGARYLHRRLGLTPPNKCLPGLGVEHVGDSRSVDFADETFPADRRLRCDVVLNSLAGEAIQRGVQILAPGMVHRTGQEGRPAADSSLAALAKSASFSVVDLDLNLKLQPARYRQLPATHPGSTWRWQTRGLPVTVIQPATCADAFRLMASGKNTGKIVTR